jgi:hypothetical protein
MISLGSFLDVFGSRLYLSGLGGVKGRLVQSSSFSRLRFRVERRGRGIDWLEVTECHLK